MEEVGEAQSKLSNLSRSTQVIRVEQGCISHSLILKATSSPLCLITMPSARGGILAGPGDCESPRESPPKANFILY